MLLTEMFEEPRSSTAQVEDDVTAIAHSISDVATLRVMARNMDGDMYITVSLLRLPKESRKSGIGSAIMQALCDYADDNGIIVVLSPTSEFGTSKATLMRFYKKFGFVNNTGSSTNHLVRETMIRYPAKNS
jgi:GNAT superfamily N-acetyltransferase